MQKTHVLGNATAFSNACYFLFKEHWSIVDPVELHPPPSLHPPEISNSKGGYTESSACNTQIHKHTNCLQLKAATEEK